MGRERGVQDLGVVLHNFYIQILPINLVSSLNWEVWSKVLLSTLLAWIKPYKSRVGPEQRENMILRARSGNS